VTPLLGFLFGKDPDETITERDVRRTVTTILSFTVCGLLALILFTFTSTIPFSWWKSIRLTGMGLLYAGAFFSVGALAGLLFGIPRSLQDKPEQKNNTANENNGTSNENSTKPIFATNTNLEEISDWLTKIIVGLGLVNLKSVPEYLKRLGWYFSNFCGSDVCEAVAMALILFFATCGFFLGYLVTRLYLTGAFTRASREVVGAQKQLPKELVELVKLDKSLRPTIAQAGGQPPSGHEIV
jgi:hypothetical protein